MDFLALPPPHAGTSKKSSLDFVENMKMVTWLARKERRVALDRWRMEDECWAGGWGLGLPTNQWGLEAHSDAKVGHFAFFGGDFCSW